MNNILILIPRILAILYMAFLSLFALDVFGAGYGFWGTVLALFIHLIPSFILIACLVIAWKREMVGGGLFLIMGVIFTIFFHTYRRLDIFLIISLPLLLIGALFIISGVSKGRKR